MSYSVREVAAMLGLPSAQIRAYAQKGFLKPERGPRGEMRFGFHDLIVLRTAGELAAANISERKVRRALQRLREQIPDHRSLTGVRIVADGERIVVSDGDVVWNPESGQSLFDFTVDEIAAKAAPLAHRAAEEARKHARDMSADEWFEFGCELENSSRDDARDAYERALRLDPEFADAHVNLGRLLHEDGSPLAAETHYRRALSIDAGHETAVFNLGVALEDLGRVREAIDAYLQALKVDPHNADAHYNLAGLYERRGEKAAALRHLKEYARMKK